MKRHLQQLRRRLPQDDEKTYSLKSSTSPIQDDEQKAIPSDDDDLCLNDDWYLAPLPKDEGNPGKNVFTSHTHDDEQKVISQDDKLLPHDDGNPCNNGEKPINNGKISTQDDKNPSKLDNCPEDKETRRSKSSSQKYKQTSLVKPKDYQHEIFHTKGGARSGKVKPGKEYRNIITSLVKVFDVPSSTEESSAFPIDDYIFTNLAVSGNVLIFWSPSEIC